MQNPFLNPKKFTEKEDIIAVGGELSAEILILAYQQGIFPWPHEGYPLLWFCPQERGVLEFKNLHLAKSLKKWIRKNESLYSFKINSQFHQVISECAKIKRPGQISQNGKPQTWITKDMIKAYTELSKSNHALSLECYDKNSNELVSGIYGVLSQNYFSCESMFFKKPNTSKLVFIKLIEYLKNEHHMQWMDIQMVTDVTHSFGGTYISRDLFLKWIS